MTSRLQVADWQKNGGGHKGGPVLRCPAPGHFLWGKVWSGAPGQGWNWDNLTAESGRHRAFRREIFETNISMVGLLESFVITIKIVKSATHSHSFSPYTVLASRPSQLPYQQQGMALYLAPSCVTTPTNGAGSTDSHRLQTAQIVRHRIHISNTLQCSLTQPTRRFLTRFDSIRLGS